MLKQAVRHLVVPGTFDPITFGHIDVIKRAYRLCPKVTVGVAQSTLKNGHGTTFSLDKRIQMVKEALFEEAKSSDQAFLQEVAVAPIKGLLVDFCAEVDAQAVVKGLRATTDFEYELAQNDFYAKMDARLESVFVMSSPEYGFVSSSLVREIASLGGDVSLLVPQTVERALEESFKEERL